MLTTTLQTYVNFLRRVFFSKDTWVLIYVYGVTALIVAAVWFAFRYGYRIQQRVKDIESRLSRGLIYREKTNPDDDNDNNNNKNRKIIRCLELHPDFVQKAHEADWNLVSFGEYLSSLRAFRFDDDDDLPQILERELSATVGRLLLNHFGPRFGAVLLPMLGFSSLQSVQSRIVAKLASWVASYVLVEQAATSWDPLEDIAAFPFSVSEIVSFVNINQKVGSAPNNETAMTSLEWMKRGEIGYDPSFCDGNDGDDDNEVSSNHDREISNTTAATVNEEDDNDDDDNKCFLPNPFIVKEHFEKAIHLMERRIQKQSVVTHSAAGANAESVQTTVPYDPEDRSFPEPTPINERILPGLHSGWGDAKCTHTKREILRNRLMACIMTKLSYNYKLKEQEEEEEKQGGENGNTNNNNNNTKKKDELFVVVISNNKKCYYPDEFIEGLLATGHTIEACPASTITTFGIAACIKEDDGSWSNIPVGFFFRTGYERPNGRPAYFVAPHGGLDLSIQGPLVDGDDDDDNTNNNNDSTPKPGTEQQHRQQQKRKNKCDIQFYVAIEGLCGWHSNHNADVPWIKAVQTTETYSDERLLQAVRMAGLLGVTFNSIATEMQLPFGGYGVLGVCNDSAAFIDCAIRGETNMYPLLSTGRYLSHTALRILKLRNGLLHNNDKRLEKAVQDARYLVRACCTMDSDIHTSPAQLIGATRRYLSNYPVSYFQLTEDSKQMMTNVATLWQDFLHRQKEDEEENATNATTNGQRSSMMGGELSGFVNFLFNSVPQKNSTLVKETK